MPFGVKIQRDPEVNKLQLSVDQRLLEIVKKVDPEPPKEEIKFVSFEDALKELIALKNS
jgi:hypothetical protein